MKTIIVSNAVWKYLYQERINSNVTSINEVLAKKLGITDDKEVIKND